MSESALATDLALALDPSGVMTRAGLVPDAWQQSLLRGRPRGALLLCTRQAGKSTTTIAVAVLAVIRRQAPGLVHGRGERERD